MNQEQYDKAIELKEQIANIYKKRNQLKYILEGDFLDSMRKKGNIFKSGLDLSVVVNDLENTLSKYYDKEELEALEKEFCEL